MQTRILSITLSVEKNEIIAGDHRGILYKLDLNLNIKTISRKMLHTGGLHVIVADNNFIYARDTVGNIMKWDADTLDPLDFICSESFTFCENDDTKPPMPVPASALSLWKDKLIVLNSRGEIVIFKKHNMVFEKIINFESDSFAECIFSPEDPPHFIADCGGIIWKGDFENETFGPLIQTNHGNSHCIGHDKRHNRYWATTDTYGGFWIFDQNGMVFYRIKMTNDDVEWLEFNTDYSMAYLACFDHFLYIYSNLEKKPKLIKKVGPFKFMLKQVIYTDENNLYVLLQSGEIYLYSINEDKIIKKIFGTNCIWSLNSIKNKDDLVCCAMENGKIATVKYGYDEEQQYYLSIIRESPDFNFGIIRKAISLSTGDFLAATESGTIFKSDPNYNIVWTRQIGYLCRDIDIDKNELKCLVCSDQGDLCELSIATGETIFSRIYDSPIYSLCYDNKGSILYAGRIFSELTDSGEFDAFTFLRVLNSDTYQEIKKLTIGGNVKRMKLLDDGNILINGNGGIGVTIIDTENYEMKEQFNEWLLNTTENALLFADKIFAITYGYQLNTYDYQSKAILDSQFTPEDYPKSLHAKNVNKEKKVLLVGGRGFLTLYDVSFDAPRIVRTVYI